jgi:hypothetical protein
MLSSVTSKRISAIIPAAGANTRLTGTVAPFLKPTILHNGKPLIQHAYEHAWNEWNVPQDQTHIVVSPNNAAILPQLFPPDTEAQFILQPEVTGIIDAIKRGLLGINTEWTLILCADNVFRLKPSNPLNDNLVPMFGARFLKAKDAQRFTTFNHNTFLSAGAQPPSLDSSTFPMTCWIGPLLLPTETLIRFLYKNESITTVLNQIHNVNPIYPHHMECSDMGVPEELL